MKRIIAILMTLIMVLGLSSVGVWADDEAEKWEREQPIPTAKREMRTEVVGNKAYVIGGSTPGGHSNKVEIYNADTDTWSMGKVPMPTKRSQMASAVVNQKIYILGGVTSAGETNIVEIYDTVSDTWTTGKPMPIKVRDHTAAAVGNKIYVIGGYNTNKLFIYDIENDVWTEGNPAPEGKSRLTSSVIGSKIYVIGGYKSNSAFSNSLDIYDTETGNWTAGAPMSEVKCSTASASIDNKIYVVGGGGTGYSFLVEIYDANTNSWSQRRDFPYESTSLNAFIINNKLYALGGIGRNSVTYDNMYSLKIKSDSDEPSAFNLTATGGNSVVDLSWGAVSGADSYTVKRSLTAGGPYTVIAEDVTGTTYSDTDVVNGTTYYYVVTAVSAGGESADSNEASATPQAPTSSGRALLVITMTNGLEKEYELSAAEINAFISWYDGKATGSGAGYYKINKTFNLGPFLTRTDYLTFDKIQNFEVMQYQ